MKKLIITLLGAAALYGCNGGSNNSTTQDLVANQTSLSTIGSLIENNNTPYDLRGYITTSIIEESGTIYAGTESGLFISASNSNSWVHKTTTDGLLSNYIQDIKYWSNKVYLINGGNAQYSSDYGNTWKTIIPACNDCKFTSIASNESGILYLLSDRTTFQQGGGYVTQGAYLSISSDQGVTWKHVALPNDIKSGFALNVNNSNLYFLDKKSTYNGLPNMSFVELKIDQNNKVSEVFNKSFWHQNPGFISQTLNDLVVDNNIYIATPAGLAVSTDHGNTFVLRGEGSGLNTANIYTVSRYDNKLYVGTDRGYSLSADNGMSFDNYFAKSINQPYASNVINIFVNNHYVLIGTENGIGIFNNSSKLTWSLNTNLPDNFSSMSIIANKLYFTAYNTVSSGTSNVDPCNQYPLTSFGEGNNLYIGSLSGLAISRDNGASWRCVNYAAGISGTVMAVAASSDNIYVGTYGQGLFMSHDGGNNWNQIMSDGIFYAVALSGNSIYLGGYRNGVYLSTDKGKTWKNYLSGTTVKSIFANDKKVYLAANDGVYISNDEGKNWSHKTNSIGSTAAKKIYVSAGNIYVLLADGRVAVSQNNGDSFVINQASFQTQVSAIYEQDGSIIVGQLGAAGYGQHQ